MQKLVKSSTDNVRNSDIVDDSFDSYYIQLHSNNFFLLVYYHATLFFKSYSSQNTIFRISFGIDHVQKLCDIFFIFKLSLFYKNQHIYRLPLRNHLKFNMQVETIKGNTFSSFNLWMWYFPGYNLFYTVWKTVTHRKIWFGTVSAPFFLLGGQFSALNFQKNKYLRGLKEFLPWILAVGVGGSLLAYYVYYVS